LANKRVRFERATRHGKENDGKAKSECTRKMPSGPKYPYIPRLERRCRLSRNQGCASQLPEYEELSHNRMCEANQDCDDCC
jgi:hypothetical protein